MTKALILLSGGRDSFLSACLSVEDGCEITPVICDNGHIEGINRAQFAVSELQKRYGPDMVHDLVKLTTGMTMQLYLLDSWRAKLSDIATSYPETKMYQIHCLTCKTAMYVHVIAYCLAHELEAIIDGMREQQGFFVDIEDMRNRFCYLCAKNGIELKTPVYDLISDLERKRKLCDRGLSTKTLEPQCFLGCPLAKKLSSKEKRDLGRFYDERLLPHLQKDISELTLSMKTR